MVGRSGCLGLLARRIEVDMALVVLALQGIGIGVPGFCSTGCLLACSLGHGELCPEGALEA